MIRAPGLMDPLGLAAGDHLGECGKSKEGKLPR